MFDFKVYCKDKKIGFYLTAVIVLLTIITAIVYAGSYAGSNEMSWVAFAFMIVGSVAGIALIVLKKFDWAAMALAVFLFLSLLFFIYGVYYYVSVVLVGIDQETFEPMFIVCTSLFFLLFSVSITNVFLKQTENKEINK